MQGCSTLHPHQAGSACLVPRAVHQTQHRRQPHAQSSANCPRRPTLWQQRAATPAALQHAAGLCTQYKQRKRRIVCSSDASGSAQGSHERPPSDMTIPVKATRLNSDLEGTEGGESGSNKQPPRSLLVRVLLGMSSLLRVCLQRLKTVLGSLPRYVLTLGGLFMVSSLFMAVGSSFPSPSYHPPQEVVYSDFVKLVNKRFVRAARFDESLHRIYFDLRPDVWDELETPAATTSGGAANQEAAASTAVAAGTAAAAPAEAPAVASGSGAEAVTKPSSNKTPRMFYTRQITDPQLIPALLASDVNFGAKKTTLVGSIGKALGACMMLWLPLVPLVFFMRGLLSGRMNDKKKGSKSKVAEKPVTFADVAGVDSAKEELREVVACLLNAQRYQQLNAKMPSGVLLCGPPGTGKTLLAKAVAGEAGVPFFAASASEFVELFVGRGAARVRDLFAEARKRAPSVVFIDELDAVGGKRGIGLNEERDQTLNQLLTELDGFEGRPGVLLLAATNRPDVLDSALTRPGRLTRRVTVPLPDERGRADILAVHLRKVPMASPEERAEAAGVLARLTSGFSGAELANVVNEAALLAGRVGATEVGMRELVAGVQRTRFGVNGGSAALFGGASTSWQRRLNDWLIDRMSSGKQMRMQRLGG